MTIICFGCILAYNLESFLFVTLKKILVHDDFKFFDSMYVIRMVVLFTVII